MSEKVLTKNVKEKYKSDKGYKIKNVIYFDIGMMNLSQRHPDLKITTWDTRAKITPETLGNRDINGLEK